MAGLRLPFPKIAWELLLFPMVAPSQIVPNASQLKMIERVIRGILIEDKMTSNLNQVCVCMCANKYLKYGI